MTKKSNAGRPLSFETPEALQAKIDEFFDLVKQGEKEPLIIALCNHLDTNKQTLLNYSTKDLYGDIVIKAKQKVEELFSVKAHKNEYQPTIAKLTMTSHYDYVTERTEINTDKIAEEDKQIISEFINAIQSQATASDTPK